METSDEKPTIKWYLRPVWVVIAILMIGPFAIPLVWKSPAFERWLKILITVILILLTVWMVQTSVTLYEALKAEMLSLQNALK